MHLTPAQADRAVGVLLASAAGDALGAGYEFGSAPLPAPGVLPRMIGGGLGGFAPGEWTDDTAQAVAIARVAATGADLRTPAALDAVAAGFAEWYAGDPADVGIQTARVLAAVGRPPSTGEAPTGMAERMRAAARSVHESTGRSAGNGSLMRTGPVALAHLDDPAALVDAAMAVSALTHTDPLAGEGAALWCLLVRRAVLTGELDARAQLDHLPAAARSRWGEVLDEAEARPHTDFTENGWVVGALQAAWSAIRSTPDDAPEHLQRGLAAAVAIGNDTDTVAAIAGALLGARWGASAVPEAWRAPLHGWPVRDGRACRATDLVALAQRTVSPR